MGSHFKEEKYMKNKKLPLDMEIFGDGRNNL
jgi:hypothetical protein